MRIDVDRHADDFKRHAADTTLDDSGPIEYPAVIAIGQADTAFAFVKSGLIGCQARQYLPDGAYVVRMNVA